MPRWCRSTARVVGTYPNIKAEPAGILDCWFMDQITTHYCFNYPFHSGDWGRADYRRKAVERIRLYHWAVRTLNT